MCRIFLTNLLCSTGATSWRKTVQHDHEMCPKSKVVYLVIERRDLRVLIGFGHGAAPGAQIRWELGGPSFFPWDISGLHVKRLKVKHGWCSVSLPASVARRATMSVHVYHVTMCRIFATNQGMANHLLPEFNHLLPDNIRYSLNYITQHSTTFVAFSHVAFVASSSTAFTQQCIHSAYRMHSWPTTFVRHILLHSYPLHFIAFSQPWTSSCI